MENKTSEYDRMSELKTFDESKLGVKGLVDSGLSKVPSIFINHQEKNRRKDDQKTHIQPKIQYSNLPMIDLAGIDKDPSKVEKIVDEIWRACDTWGYFQVINHGIPRDVLDEMIRGVRRFHEEDPEVKKKYYCREFTDDRKFTYFSNYYLYTGPVTNWRDTFWASMAPNPPRPGDVPVACRDILFKFTKHVTKLGHTLLELISMGLGLKPTHLKDIECSQELMLLGNYYPSCPEPDLAIGIGKHADNDVLTILLQDEVGGLEVLHQDQWVDVPYVPGALVINTGDILQLITNDKMKSVYHRVGAQEEARISVGVFFKPHLSNTRLYGPIKELTTEQNPSLYKDTTMKDYLSHYYKTGQDGRPALEKFKLTSP